MTDHDEFTTIWDPGVEEPLDRYLAEHGREAKFQVLRCTWNPEGTVRTIHEIRITDDN